MYRLAGMFVAVVILLGAAASSVSAQDKTLTVFAAGVFGHPARADALAKLKLDKLEAVHKRRRLALLFKRLATLRTDAPLFSDVQALRWLGATEAFDEWAVKIGDQRLLPRVQKLITDVVRN